MSKKREKKEGGLSQKKLDFYKSRVNVIRKEIGRIVVGQDEIVNSLLESLFANGHVLLEGVPGIGKTLVLRAMSNAIGCVFSRIQFTPDLLPSDIIGVTTYDETKGFYTVKGPIFANFVLADEINRSPPKVQSALLEGMQEKQVTIGKKTFALPIPFFVMATQNPVEQLGTYKLPEAQVDRFLYKIIMEYPDYEQEIKILNKNITTKRFEEFDIKPIFSPEEILKAQDDVKKVGLNQKIERYVVRLVDATRNPAKYELESGKFIDFGASPRASIGLFIASKARALIKGRAYVTPQDVKDVAFNVLRHRILLNFEGEAEEINTEDIIKEILKKVPII
ncbi:MAG: MoxR family ATPase [archaeon]